MRAFLAAMVLAMAFLIPNLGHAQQQPVCMPRPFMVVQLIQNYGEEVVAFEEKDGVLFEFWGNRETGTYTFTQTNTATQIICAIESGVGWAPEPGDPA